MLTLHIHKRVASCAASPIAARADDGMPRLAAGSIRDGGHGTHPLPGTPPVMGTGNPRVGRLDAIRRTLSSGFPSYTDLVNSTPAGECDGEPACRRESATWAHGGTPGGHRARRPARSRIGVADSLRIP